MRYIPDAMTGVVVFDSPNVAVAENEAERLRREERRAWITGNPRRAFILRRRANKMTDLSRRPA